MPEKKPHTNIYLLILAFISITLFLSNFGITFFVAADKGQTAEIGENVISNPHFGAVKGTLKFVIKDGNVVISEEKGSSYRIYLSRQAISDYSLIKNSADTSFSGALTSVDPDDDSSTCSSSSFTTQKMFYDENNDGVQQENEKDVYSILTDSNGCFAVKVAPGVWDIYG